jgi:hypothetical protein
VTFFEPLTIEWKVETAEGPLAAGVSTHPVYVLLGAPESTVGKDAVYLTLVALTTHSARGEAQEAGTIDKIWGKFASLNVQRQDLDPAKGVVNPGAQLTYYKNWLTQCTTTADCSKMGTVAARPGPRLFLTP